MALCVATSAAAAAFLYVISSTNLENLMSACSDASVWGVLRFQPYDVTDEPALIAAVVAHLPCPIHHLDPFHPLIRGELDFPRKIMEVPDETGHHLAHARGCLWAH